MQTLHSDLQARLKKLAYRKSHAFCDPCNIQVSGTHCELCHSDDLARGMAGWGVTWHIAEIIEHLISENLTPINVSEMFEEYIGQCYPETTTIGWMTYDTVSAMKELDPVSWRLAESEWLDQERSEGQVCTFDNESTYYLVSDVEDYLDEEESEEGAA